MNYDYKTFYEKNAAFFNGRPRLKKALIKTNTLLTSLFFIAYLLLIGFQLKKDIDLGELSKLIFIPALTLFLVSVLQFTIKRPRPYAADGAGIAPFIKKKKENSSSFPSRHTASAFVIALVFLPYFTAVGIMLLLLSFVMGYIRFALGLHYPSDVVCGGVLGAIIGALIFIL